MKRLFVASILSLTACVHREPNGGPVSIPTTPVVTEHAVVDTTAIVEEPVIEKQTPENLPSKPKVIAKRTILIIGDSEACAVAPEVKKAKLPTDTVYVDCKGGTVVQYWGSGGNFKAALSRHPKPDVVLVFLGTNHYWQKTTPPVETVLKTIRERGFKCVWVGPTAVHNQHWPMNDLIRDAVQPTCDYFDTETASIKLHDGVHPYGAAALDWLQKIWPMIPMKYEEQSD